MINLLSVKSSVFEKESVIVEVYKTCSKGIPHKFTKTMIKPFMPAMKKANNIILFVNNDLDITGGQIGLYTYEEGLQVLTF